LGPAYTPPKTLKKKVVIYNGTLPLDQYLAKIIKKNDDNENFKQWRESLLNKFEERFDNTKDPFVDTTFGINHNIKNKIKLLQDKFVFSCIDKASKNYSIICKNFYIDLVLKEVGFHSGGNDTYELCDNPKDQIIDDLRKKSTQLGIIPTTDSLTLPFIQITPKMHKNPIGSRTIISSRRCVTKQLSKDIGKCLKLVFQNLTKYCNTIFNATHINPMFIISNNKPITETINHLGIGRRLEKVATYDFEKLYTNLKHEDISVAMSEAVNIGFANNDRHIKITSFKAFWATSKENNRCISKEELLKMLSTLINNAYFSVGNKTFRQKIGVPMGTDCAPLIANLFLFSFEFKYVMNLLKSGNFKEAINLRHVYRYIDDITIINDADFFHNNYKDIYPNSLTLKKINTSNLKADVLDISIEIKNDKSFISSVYDKRDDFDFSIINFPHMKSNINKKMAYNVYKEEIRRYLRICSSHTTFGDKCLQLEQNLVNKGYSRKELFYHLNKVVVENVKFHTYNITPVDFLFQYRYP
jgi:hypothetical protein